jgi:glutamate synthase domain-containing protein 2
VTLGLAAVARRAFPAWGVSLEAFIIAMIGVHELAGPVCLRRALALVGELKEAHDVKDAALVGADVVAVGRGGL